MKLETLVLNEVVVIRFAVVFKGFFLHKKLLFHRFCNSLVHCNTSVQEDGSDGEDGTDGEDGQTPFIGENGNWWIGSVDTGIPAKGENGTDGKDGISITNVDINDAGELILYFSEGEPLNLGKIVTIENLTLFFSFSCAGVCAVYLGGFCNHLRFEISC